MWFIVWLAPRAGKMNQILRCDWLPERARYGYLARSGLPAVSHKFPQSHIINPLLTKFVRSRWLDIGLVLFFASLWTSHLVNNPYIQNCVSSSNDIPKSDISVSTVKLFLKIIFDSLLQNLKFPWNPRETLNYSSVFKH